MKVLRPCLEMLVPVAIIFAFGFWLNPNNLLVSLITPRPYLLVVVLAAVKYGSPVGFIIAFVCALLDIATLVFTSDQTFSEAILLNASNLLPIGVYLAFGHFIGESVHSRMEVNKHNLALLAEKKKLADVFAGEKTELENKYRQLETGIAAESRSNHTFIRDLKHFDTLTSQQAGEYTLKLVGKYFTAASGNIWYKKGRDWQELTFTPVPEVKAVPEMVFKAEDSGMMAACRDYPEIARRDGIDLAVCIRSERTGDKYALTCSGISFKSWNLQLEERVRFILREALAVFDFQRIRSELENTTSLELQLRVEGMSVFKNIVRHQLLTLQRNKSTSTLVFICIERGLASDIRVLGIIASGIRCRLRRSDVLSFATEENYFALFLPQTSLEGATVALRKITEAIDRLGLKPDNREILLNPAYYEVSEAVMLEDVFENFRKELRS